MRVSTHYSEKYFSEFFKTLIINVPNFPKEGVIFRDISKILTYPSFVEIITDCLYNNTNKDIDMVVGLDARGFIIAPLLAQTFNCGFAMCRKPTKLPPPFSEMEYNLEYGTNKLSLSSNIIKKGMKVHVHDDILATGGSAQCAIKLIEKMGAEVVSLSFIIELTELNGKEKLKGYDYYSLIKY